MSTVHIDAKKEDIKKIVLMPGDPLRAKYIAENFLSEYYQVNHTRGMLAYTGKYEGVDVTVFASGMGCASMGIYAYELYQFYDVETIIRIGTSGAISKDLELLDIIIADSSYEFSHFSNLFFQDDSQQFFATKALNDQLEETAKKKGFSYLRGDIATVDVFDPYVENKDYIQSLYQNIGNLLASEMEASALFSIAKHLGRNATCLLSVVDSPYQTIKISREDREKALNNMIQLALDTIHNL